MRQALDPPVLWRQGREQRSACWMAEPIRAARGRCTAEASRFLNWVTPRTQGASGIAQLRTWTVGSAVGAVDYADRELGRPSTFGLQGVCPLSRSVAARLNGRVGRDTAVQERRQGILHGLRDALLVPRHLEAELRQTTHLGRRRAASRACRSSRLINQRVDRVPLCVSHAGMAFAADCEAVPQCVQLGDRF